MKSVLKLLCRSCFESVCSLGVLCVFFVALRAMILTGQIVFQVIAVALLAGFGLACAAGAVLLVLAIVKRNTKPVAEDEDHQGSQI